MMEENKQMRKKGLVEQNNSTTLIIKMGLHQMYTDDNINYDHIFSIEIPNKDLSEINFDLIFKMFDNSEYNEDGWTEFVKFMGKWTNNDILMKEIFEYLWPLAQELVEENGYEDPCEAHIYSIKLQNKELKFFIYEDGYENTNGVFDEYGTDIILFGELIDGSSKLVSLY